MLTESEVQRSFRKILKTDAIDATCLDRAEALLEELRPESPLRFKLGEEVKELRQIHVADASM